MRDDKNKFLKRFPTCTLLFYLTKSFGEQVFVTPLNKPTCKFTRNKTWPQSQAFHKHQRTLHSKHPWSLSKPNNHLKLAMSTSVAKHTTKHQPNHVLKLHQSTVCFQTPRLVSEVLAKNTSVAKRATKCLPNPDASTH